MKLNKNMIIFLICYIAYTSIYIARLNLSMASPALIEAAILSTAEVGMMGSIFSIIYSVGRFVNGYLGDRCHPTVMISTGLIIAGISNLALGLMPPFIGMLLLWGANAFAQSMLWGSVLCIISNIYDEKTARKMTSFMVTSVAGGNILGIILNTIMINRLGTAFAFIIPGALLIVVCAIFIPISCKTPRAENTSKHMSMFALFKESNIRTGLIPSFLHGVMKDNISLWMTLFFVAKYSIDLNLSAGFVLFIPIIGFIGRMLYPACLRLSRGDEHKVSLVAFIACIVLAVPLCLPYIPPILAAICLAGIYAAVSLVNTSMLSIFPMRFLSTGNVASVSGIMDFATYLGAGVASLAYGFLIDLFRSYNPMFISWTLVSFISIFAVRKLSKNCAAVEV